jgi:GT2 family glycosyltransferase
MPEDPSGRPPFAVVVVTFDSAAVLGDCLRSVETALTEAGIAGAPVIVVDNASSDGTRAAAEAFSGVRVLARTTNGGFAAGVNAGLSVVPGHDVLVLNPDVRLDVRAVALLRRRLAAPGTGIAVPRLLHSDGSLQLSLRRRPTALRAMGEALIGGTRAGRMSPLGELVCDEHAYADRRRVDWATGAVWLVSAECVAAIGLLDERYFLYCEETEYMLRAGDAGFAVQYEPEASAVHVGGEQSTSPYLWALSVTNRVRLQRSRTAPLRRRGCGSPSSSTSCRARSSGALPEEPPTGRHCAPSPGCTTGPAARTRTPARPTSASPLRTGGTTTPRTRTSSSCARRPRTAPSWS